MPVYFLPMKTVKKITYLAIMLKFSVQVWLPKAEFYTTKSLLMQDLVFRLDSSVNSTRKIWKKNGKKTSHKYLSVNSVNGSDIEIINIISLTYFLQLVKTPVKTRVKNISELISYLTSLIWNLVEWLQTTNYSNKVESTFSHPRTREGWDLSFTFHQTCFLKP